MNWDQVAHRYGSYGLCKEFHEVVEERGGATFRFHSTCVPKYVTRQRLPDLL
jgi:hypothetical protein